MIKRIGGTRTQLTRAVGAAATVLALAACGGDKEKSAGDEGSTMGTTEAPGGAAGATATPADTSTPAGTGAAASTSTSPPANADTTRAPGATGRGSAPPE